MTLKNNVKIGSLLFKIHQNNDFKKRKIKKNIYNYGFTEPFFTNTIIYNVELFKLLLFIFIIIYFYIFYFLFYSIQNENTK